MKFGGVLHALGNYIDFDYELPYLKLFPYENMIFETIQEIDLEQKKIIFLNQNEIYFDYLIFGDNFETTQNDINNVILEEFLKE